MIRTRLKATHGAPLRRCFITVMIKSCPCFSVDRRNSNENESAQILQLYCVFLPSAHLHLPRPPLSGVSAFVSRSSLFDSPQNVFSSRISAGLSTGDPSSDLCRYLRLLLCQVQTGWIMADAEDTDTRFCCSYLVGKKVHFFLSLKWFYLYTLNLYNNDFIFFSPWPYEDHGPAGFFNVPVSP